MSPGMEPAAPTGAEAATLYVAIEISRKGWVIGSPSSIAVLCRGPVETPDRDVFGGHLTLETSCAVSSSRHPTGEPWT